MDLVADFKKNGFVILPQVFSPTEVADYRTQLAEIFSKSPERPGDRQNIRFDPLPHHAGLRKTLAKKPVIEALTKLLGAGFLLLPEVSIHDSGLYGGWHRDTGSQESVGKRFHFSSDYNVVNVAIYFQDNHPKYGGGLDIVPGSHLTKSSWWQNQKASNRKIKFVLSHLDKRNLIPKSIMHGRKGQYSIPSKAGDVVIFHTHCEHRPTHPKIDPLPPEYRKFALFLLFSSNNAHARNYVDFIRTRPDYLYLKNAAPSLEYFEELESLGIRSFT